MQFFSEFFTCLWRVDNDGTLRIQTCSAVDCVEKRFVNDYYVVRLIDVRVDSDRVCADAVEAVIGAPILSGPYSGKPWTCIPVLNATSASSSDAVLAP